MEKWAPEAAGALWATAGNPRRHDGSSHSRAGTDLAPGWIEEGTDMMTTFTDPMVAMVGSQAFSLGLASPVTDLTWLAPLSFAAALWLVIVVARGIVRDRPRRTDTAATPPAEIKQAA
jgi:hypothetical protein